jgi:hypothetical protein
MSGHAIQHHDLAVVDLVLQKEGNMLTH